MKENTVFLFSVKDIYFSDFVALYYNFQDSVLDAEHNIKYSCDHHKHNSSTFVFTLYNYWT